MLDNSYVEADGRNLTSMDLFIIFSFVKQNPDVNVVETKG
jgi:hypothetical protein